MKDRLDQTRSLLERWHGGDREALDELLARDLDWVRRRVRLRLGGELREKVETMDLVQDAMVDALRYGPRVALDDRDAFRALLGRIVENNIRDRVEWARAARRSARRERELLRDTILYLDKPRRDVTSPVESAEQGEDVERLRLAMELLDDGDRRVIQLRQFEQRPFEEIGELLDCPANTARMRFQRALGKLAKKVEDIESRGAAAWRQDDGE